jgi:hypothetical protein
MTYIPNRIRVPTHGGDLGHHELRVEEKTQELPMEPLQPKGGGGRKRKNDRQTFMLTSHARSFSVTESCHFIWCDLCMGCVYCSSIMEANRVMCTDVTP